MGSPASLQQNIIFLCSEFSHTFSRRLDSLFRENGHNFTPGQFAVLVVLWYKDGINQNEISQQLNRDKTTIARVIGNMIKNGLVSRTTDTYNKRANCIHLTQKGKDIQTKCLQLSGGLYMEILKNVDENSLNNGIELLKKMTNNLTQNK